MNANPNRYGYLSIIFHWILAVALLALYYSGDYMVTLDYYDSWYHRAPELHKAFGIVIGILMLLRFLWNKSQGLLKIETAGNMLNLLAYAVHHLFYLLVLLLAITGYLVTTAKGQGIDVFGWYSVPAFFAENTEVSELSGMLHDLIAIIFMILFVTHTLAALYHHFIIRDNTLKSMLGKDNNSQN